MLWTIIAVLLIAIGTIVTFVGWIMSIIEGFRAHAGWGFANILGGLCLFYIPQLIFILTKISDRWPLLVLILGGILPSAIGFAILFFEGVLGAAA
jgi:hypothetical protein